MMDWLTGNVGTVMFYSFIIILIYFNRKKFEFQGIVGLYKTNLGIKYMKKYAEKYPKTIGFLAILGIWIGYIGMIAILAMVIYSVHQLIFNPQAPPAFTPVFPGFQVPGGPKIPLVQGLLALFIVVVIHEFAHGVVSKLYKIKIKSSGLAILGPIPAAFVEPDQKALEKASAKKQLGIYAAGPFSNILLGIVMILVINLGLLLTAVIYQPSGVSILDFNESDQRLQEFNEREIILGIGNESVNTAYSLQLALRDKNPGDIVSVQTNKGLKELQLTHNPRNESLAYMGFMLDQEVSAQVAPAIFDIIKKPYFWVMGNPYDIRTDPLLGWLGKSFIGWVYILTIGIGLVNLLPIGPVDGGRMIKIALDKVFNQKLSRKIWLSTSWTLVIVIAVLLFVPIIRNLV